MLVTAILIGKVCLIFLIIITGNIALNMIFSLVSAK